MNFDTIRPYHDQEVNSALTDLINHSMMKALFDYAFPGKDINFYNDKIKEIHSIYDFHSKVIYPALSRVIKETANELGSFGFEQLDQTTSYLYISNHRDIVLDTSITNLVLLENKLRMTASAIGDNLVGTPFLHKFSKINRNFLVHRSLSPRDMLIKSKELSAYIPHLMKNGNSIWLAQKEGRTKDGNDQTNPGILKMLSLNKPKEMHLCDYFKTLNIIPLSISYEYDPTDYMKMPAVLAALNGVKYKKTKNEDFNNILKGVLGYKKDIHLVCGTNLDDYLDELKEKDLSVNLTIKAFAQKVTEQIQINYQLHETNYIAFDILNNTEASKAHYTEDAVKIFIKRMAKSIDIKDAELVKNFLLMYANPVINKLKIQSYA